jgi:ATP-dependent helicase/nuclease subunit A
LNSEQTARMTEPSALALDDLARQRLRTDLDTTFFVEAGAGTGKTTAIVARIVELVAKGRATAGSLVAITFTEAAAGELRSRVREALEIAARNSARPEQERRPCATAVENLDDAAISTIHAFAADLLRAYPFEAGCPARIEVMDETAEAAYLEERFRRWFEAAPEQPWAPALQRVLELGMQPWNLEALATGLTEKGDLLAETTTWRALDGGDIEGLVADIGRRLRALGDGAGLPNHGFTEALKQARLVRDRAESAGTVDEMLAVIRLAAGMASVRGNQSDWQAAGVDKLAGARIKDEIGAVQRGAEVVLEAARSQALANLLPWLRDWVIENERQRKANGTATFQDLLAWATELLRQEPVHRNCLRRWSHVIVDEFQDTDPLQAEMAVLLSATEPDDRSRSWLEAALIPGRLCVVGDPKQSIYRFRRADIAIYDAVRRLVLASGGEVVTLSRNYRCVESIIAVVNEHFDRVIEERPGGQPPYVPLLPYWEGQADHVWVVGHDIDGMAGQVWQAEADAVAESSARIVAGGWEVRDADPVKGSRPAMYCDICVLIPSRTNIRRLERAFERVGVPYRLESGSLILQTQEVRDLLSVLRAVDDPSDQVAVVTSLRSAAYGCSDLELYAWKAGGGKFDPIHPGVGDEDRVALGLADLRRRNADRHEVSVPAMIEKFIAERMVAVAAFGEPRPREMLRRLRWVVDQTRAIARGGQGTLRETVEALEALARQQPRVDAGASTETDEDSVRVLTVHGAKGLEFPIVIMTGLGSQPPSRTESILADRLAGEIEIRVKANDPDGQFLTRGYAGAKSLEEILAREERQRLLYVAATRARDHLIVSVFRPGGSPRDAAAWAETIALFDGVDRALAIQRLDTLPGPAPAAAVGVQNGLPETSAADQKRAEEDWEERREKLLRERSDEKLATATSKAHEPEPPEAADADGVAAFRRGRGGTALGRAVHTVMQDVSLEDPSSLDGLARVQANVEGIPDRENRIAELAQWVWKSEPVRRAVASGRYWREVPVGAMLGDELVEGFIDLLYEEGRDLVVVDYKTDNVSRAEMDSRMENYAIQGRVYADLLRSVSGREVGRCEFVFPAARAVRIMTTAADRWPGLEVG